MTAPTPVNDYGGVATTTAFLSVVDENRAGTTELNCTDGPVLNQDRVPDSRRAVGATLAG